MTLCVYCSKPTTDPASFAGADWHVGCISLALDKYPAEKLASLLPLADSDPLRFRSLLVTGRAA